MARSRSARGTPPAKSQGSGAVTPPDWYRRLILSLFLATFLIRASFGVVLTVFPAYTGIKHDLTFGLLSAAAPTTELLTVLLIGVYIDRYGRRGILLLGLLIGGVSNLLIATTTELYLLVLVNMLHGVASGAILVSSLALLADYAPTSHRGREIGMFDGINLAGWASGFLLGGVALDAFAEDPQRQLRIVFIVSAILALAGLAFAYRNLREPRQDQVTVARFEMRHILEVLTKGSILLLIGPWLVIYVLIGAILAFGAKSGQQDFGLPGWQIGGMLAAGTMGIVLFQRGYGALSDRWGRVKVMALGAGGIIGVMALLAGAYFTTPGAGADPSKLLDVLTGNYLLLGLLGLFVLLSGAFAPAALASLADEAPVTGRGITMGLYSFVVSLGQIIGPVGFGYMSSTYGGNGVVGFLIGLGVAMGALVGIRWVTTRAGALEHREPAAEVGPDDGARSDDAEE